MKYKEELPDMASYYDHKLIFVTKTFKSHFDEEKAKNSPAKMKNYLDKLDEYLSEDGAQFALGKGANYSLADVITTVLISRLYMHGEFFDAEVATRPRVMAYYERM